MDMWLLKVNFERVLIVLLSESIRITWLVYWINFSSDINDRYCCAHLLTRIISISFLFRSLYCRSFVRRCMHWWTEEYKHHLGLLLWLSITDKKKKKEDRLERQRSTLTVRTIWWTTTGCRRKSITHIFTRMSVRCFFLFDINSHHLFSSLLWYHY